MALERESRKPPDPPEVAAEYEPPAVSWEEPFEPVAASNCCNPLEGDCSGSGLPLCP